MPWYQPGASRGYSKFYDQGSNDPDRIAGSAYVASDAYLSGLITAHNQAILDAGGREYDSSDALTLDSLAEAGVTTTSEAAAIGYAKGTEQYRAEVLQRQKQGIAAPPAPTKPPPTIMTMGTSGGDAVGFLSLDGLPTSGGSAQPNPLAAGFVAQSSLSPFSPGPSAKGGFSLTTLLLIGAIGVGGWYLLKGK